jgi:hypothetical protein
MILPGQFGISFSFARLLLDRNKGCLDFIAGLVILYRPYKEVSCVQASSPEESSMIRLTLRRSRLSSRAMARWLRPARCRARTVCSRVGAAGSSSGASCASGGAAWYRGAGPMSPARAPRPVRMSIISSSKEPTSASAGQALTSAPTGPCPTHGPGSPQPWHRSRPRGSTPPGVVPAGPGGWHPIPPWTRPRSARLP